MGELSSGAPEIIRIVPPGRRGRVEIKYMSEWGTICDDNWDINDAKVVCRMLGYTRAVAAYTAAGGAGQIMLDDVNCSGSETSILNCEKKAWKDHNCNHSEDAGVEWPRRGRVLDSCRPLVTLDFHLDIKAYYKCWPNTHWSRSSS
ncbi:LOW QUALITY PROTEIN: macrophage receptor MARCO-like [Gastrophryne carolinensis]